MSAVVNREYKDRLFAFIFGKYENRSWTLALYNAVNGSSYERAEDIEINTLGDAVYMGMKNDVSFVLYEYLSIYEQQSTYNPNIPLRGLMYAGRLYDKYVHQKRLNIYGEARIKIPVPRLVVFYNGRRNKEDEVLNLYDLFDDKEKAAESDISVSVRMININYGDNKEILKKCKPLMEYSYLITKIRENAKAMEIEEAIDKALDSLPKDFELKRFLIAHRAEVKNMCLTEYNEEETMELFYEDGRADGKVEGIIEGKLVALYELVKDGIISVAEAAGRMGMTEEMFLSKMK